MFITKPSNYKEAYNTRELRTFYTWAKAMCEMQTNEYMHALFE